MVRLGVAVDVRVGLAVHHGVVDVALEAAAAPEAPKPAPYPIQRNLTGAMRNDAAQAGDLDRMQAWAGQSAALGATDPADEVTDRLWSQARELLNLSTS